MKLLKSPYCVHVDGLDIMIADSDFEDVKEIYYRKPGYTYIYAFGLPNVHTMPEIIQIARNNAELYSEVLFK